MGSLRPYVARDLTMVVDLHRRVWLGRNASKDVLRRTAFYYSHALLQNPWQDAELPSLVYEREGRVVGFMGVIPRTMRFREGQIRVAIATRFMVDPAVRGSGIAAALLRRLFRGPQDLLLATGNEQGRRAWEAMGGSKFPSRSLEWIRPLRPFLLALSTSTERSNALLRISRPLCRPLDALARRSPSPLAIGEEHAHLAGRHLETDKLLDCINRASLAFELAPIYDENSLQWLLDFLAAKEPTTRLYLTGVYSKDRDLLGWYIHRIRPPASSQVLQFGAFGRAAGSVLSHLVSQSLEQGAAVVQGRFEPYLLTEVGQRGFIGRPSAWFLGHAREQSLLAAIASGDVFLSALEGEL